MELPELDGIQWERKKTGTLEAWYCPEAGKRNRAGKVYLGQIGKRRLAEMQITLDADGFRAALVEWIAERRKAKGV